MAPTIAVFDECAFDEPLQQPIWIERAIRDNKRRLTRHRNRLPVSVDDVVAAVAVVVVAAPFLISVTTIYETSADKLASSFVTMAETTLQTH